MCELVQEILFNAETYSQAKLNYKLRELQLVHLAKSLKRRFPDDTRSINELKEVIKNEYKIK